MSNTAKHKTTKGKPGEIGNSASSGAPKGNKNGRGNLRHGLRAGELPKDCKYIETRLNAFRRKLEDCVLASKREVNVTDAAYIQTALRWERHAALALRWLTKAGEALKPADRLHFSREIAKASAERDKALSMLQLDAPPPDPWAAITLEQPPEEPSK